MEKYETNNVGIGGPSLLQTYTQKAVTANAFAVKMSEEFLKQVECVTISDFFPVILNGELHYTFTITGSNYY